MDWPWWFLIGFFWTIAEHYAGNVNDEQWNEFYKKFGPAVDIIEEKIRNGEIKLSEIGSLSNDYSLSIPDRMIF